MKFVPGFVWLQSQNRTWFLVAIDDIGTVCNGSEDDTAKICYRNGGDTIVLHTPQDIGEFIHWSRCEEIRMREQARDEFRRLP